MSKSILVCQKSWTKTKKVQRANAKSQLRANTKSQLGQATEIFQIYSIGYPEERRGETARWGHYFNSLIIFFIITVR